MKYREIITIKGWQDGSGWSYSQTYSDQIIEVPENILTEDMDWTWWEANEPTEGEDTEITVDYYAADSDHYDGDKPLASWSIWESELSGENTKCEVVDSIKWTVVKIPKKR